MLAIVTVMLIMLQGAKADVALQPDSYLDYVPNLGGNTALAVIYTILALTLFWHTFRTGRKVDKWALCLPIGASFEAMGFWLRLPMRTSQHNEPLYTVMYMFVVLAPAAFLAFNYILFGRLTAALEGHKPTEVARRSPYSFIPPRWVKLIFVTSDICTFCVQATGGGMQTSQDYNTSKLGNKIFLAGVSAQGASYLLFTALVLVAHFRLIRQFGLRRFSPFNVLHEPTVILIDLLYISSVGIIVRSVYRVVEMAQGYGGYLYSHEIFTFLLDALPLVIAIGVWALYWPGLLITSIRETFADDAEKQQPHSTLSSHSNEEAPRTTSSSSA
jgi:hypothetical protein